MSTTICLSSLHGESRSATLLVPHTSSMHTRLARTARKTRSEVPPPRLVARHPSSGFQITKTKTTMTVMVTTTTMAAICATAAGVPTSAFDEAVRVTKCDGIGRGDASCP